MDWNLYTFSSLFILLCRTPRWVRGLKLDITEERIEEIKSHPTMGAWIEINHIDYRYFWSLVAPHDGCVDWNFLVSMNCTLSATSHPTMGAWIEILFLYLFPCYHTSRTPRWVRGLKLFIPSEMGYRIRRRTPRWVRGLKLHFQEVFCRNSLGRTPRWVRGLKFASLNSSTLSYPCRTPRWVRGLKCRCYVK